MPILLSLLGNWRVWVLLLLAGAVGTAWIQTKRLDHAKTALTALQEEFESFKATVAAEGKIAQQRAIAHEAADKLNKEKVDAENVKTRAADLAAIARLRNANPSRSTLPSAPSDSKRPDLACFDRIEYLREDGRITQNLFAGARILADEGTTNTIDLNSAKTWAMKMSTTLAPPLSSTGR